MLTNTYIHVILEILFLYFNNVDAEFVKLVKLIWKSYITTKVLLNTSQVKLINKKEFTQAILNENSKTFMVYIVALETMLIHLSRTSNI